jgi:predicted DCC family thiol-disulfide oxidoreductase YuxK
MAIENPAIGRAARGRLAVLYDGACAMCQEMIARLKAIDNSNTLDLLDLHDEQLRARFPGLELSRIMEELHAVDDQGRVYRGARAVNEIMRRQRGILGVLAMLWYIPGYPRLAEWQYRRIARSRYRDALGRTVDPDGWCG